MHKNSSISVTVYAYETNKEITNGEAILMSGQIDNNGQMRGHPLQFYVLGDDIKVYGFLVEMNGFHLWIGRNREEIMA